MVTNINFDLETVIFDYIDELKFLCFPDQWGGALFDYSKNELLTLIFLYRRKNANMTEIAEYINAPLNTATGVVSRLEKKHMLDRIRDTQDRRVVNIVLTEKAEDFINEEKKLIDYYFKQVYSLLTEEERLAAAGVFKKVVSVLKSGKNTKEDNKKVKKIKRITVE